MVFRHYTTYITCYNLDVTYAFKERFDDMNRRSFLKRMLGGTLALMGLGGGTYYYAREIEPTLLSISKETIRSSKIPVDFQDYKIIQFTDTHIGFHYSMEQLKELVAKINAENPDIILFTGYLVYASHTFGWYWVLIQPLPHLLALYGYYW